MLALPGPRVYGATPLDLWLFDGLAAWLGLETNFGIMFLAHQPRMLLHETSSDVVALPKLREDRTFGDKESDPFLIESPCILCDHGRVRRVRLLTDDPAGAVLDTDGVLQPAVDPGVKKSPWQEETIAPGMLPEIGRASCRERVFLRV